MGSGISKEVLPERLDEESFMAVSKIMLSDIFHKKKDKDGYLTKALVLDFLKALSLFTTGDFPPNYEENPALSFQKGVNAQITQETFTKDYSPDYKITALSISPSDKSSDKIPNDENKAIAAEKAIETKPIVPTIAVEESRNRRTTEKPRSPRLNNLFPAEQKGIEIHTIEAKAVPPLQTALPSPKRTSPERRRREKEVRLIDFDNFKSHGSFPRYPDNKKLTTTIDKVDRHSSIIIFVSYFWLRKATSDQSQQHPDNASSDLYRLCIEGLSKTCSSLAPGMQKCYLWVDYCCLNQDMDIVDEMQNFDKVMAVCDCIFTPLHVSLQPNLSTQSSLLSASFIPNDGSLLSESVTQSDDYFAKELCSVSKAEGTQYLNNSWCRLHMLYGATVPLYSQSSIAEEKEMDERKANGEFSAYYVDFEGDNPNDLRAAKFSPGLRVHTLCGRRPHLVYSSNESKAGRVPKILPLFHFLFYERYDPEQGEVFDAQQELPALKKLVMNLAPFVVFPSIGYDGEYDSEDGTVNGQGRYVYEDGSIYTGAFRSGRKHGQGYLIYSNGCMYAGNYKDDHMHGFGIYKYATGDVYAGKYIEDRKNGQGTYFYVNGDVYEGQLKDGKMNGMGVFRYTNGDVYEGEFKGDLKDGYGKLKYHSGAVFTGIYVEDRRCGHGVYEYTSGDVYDGDWKDGVMSGNGVFKYKNGDVYKGSFLHDKKHGHGTFLYKNGDVYEGEYRENKKNGKGIYKYISNVIYEGEFKDNKKHGLGHIRYSSGDQYTGEWKEGKRHGKGTLTRINGDVYEGEFVADQKNGFGVVKYAANGDRFEGYFLNDKKHGKGVYTYSNGYSYEGQWKEGNTVSELD